MSVQLELIHLGGAIIALFSIVAFFWKFMFGQFEKRVLERIESHEALTKKDIMFIDANKKALDKIREDVSHLPLEYVRRDDFIREISVIDGKLDAIFNKIDEIRRGDRSC
uniref:Uncharacterized protein n=1 Tax=Candidatus Kentrum sp. LFY TaxID=2126342 RepID=A0A450WXK2_9GAMM|nr:MAG: hypothetical protein BECKLFY1418C_GA0070996_110212 [Candidatus Kentron sp. LFY]